MCAMLGEKVLYCNSSNYVKSNTTTKHESMIYTSKQNQDFVKEENWSSIKVGVGVLKTLINIL